MGWQLEDVDKPFVAPLQALGWTHAEGGLDAPAVTGRANCAEVIQADAPRGRLRVLNTGPDGQPWLGDARISEAVGVITRLGTHELTEASQKATELLIKGLTVEGLPGWDGGRHQTIRQIGRGTPANNRSTMVSEYSVDLLALDGTWIQRSRNG